MKRRTFLSLEQALSMPYATLRFVQLGWRVIRIMLAAETLVDALAQQDFGAKTLGGYAERFRSSWAYEKHYQARNFAPSVQRGIFFFGLNEPLRMLPGGRGLEDNMALDPGHTHMKRLEELPAQHRKEEEFAFDGKLTFSKEHLVQFSGTAHEPTSPRTSSSPTPTSAVRPAPRSTATPARTSARRRSTRWSRTARRRGARSSSSTTRTASTARPATSPTPIKSSPGRPPNAANTRALAQDARMVVMDEPTANLDFGNQVRVLERIRGLANEGIGVLLSTHDPDHAFLCADRVAMLHHGELVACGAAAEVMTADKLQQLYGVALAVTAVTVGNAGTRNICLPLSAL